MTVDCFMRLVHRTSTGMPLKLFSRGMPALASYYLFTHQLKPKPLWAVVFNYKSHLFHNDLQMFFIKLFCVFLLCVHFGFAFYENKLFQITAFVHIGNTAMPGIMTFRVRGTTGIQYGPFKTSPTLLSKLLHRSNKKARYAVCYGYLLWWNYIQWRHNERDGVSNHQPYHTQRLFRLRSEKTLKLRVTAFVGGNH